MSIENTDITNAIIAGIASNDNAIDQTAQILANLKHAGFAIVPVVATPEIIAAGKWLHDFEGADCWQKMVSAASQ